jgi:hypothetical protein
LEGQTLWLFRTKISLTDARAHAVLEGWTRVPGVSGANDGPFLWQGTYYLIDGSTVYTVDESTLTLKQATFNLSLPLGSEGCYSPFTYPLGVCCTTTAKPSQTTMFTCLSLDDGHLDYVHSAQVGTISGTITLSSQCALMPTNSLAPGMVSCLATDQASGSPVLAIITAETVAVAGSLDYTSAFAVKEAQHFAVTAGAGGDDDCALAVSGFSTVRRWAVDVWYSCAELPLAAAAGSDETPVKNRAVYRSVPSMT